MADRRANFQEKPSQWSRNADVSTGQIAATAGTEDDAALRVRPDVRESIQRMNADRAAYEHYRAYCLSLHIRPASEVTYLKETESLNKAPNQMPKNSASHQPQRDNA